MYRSISFPRASVPLLEKPLFFVFLRFLYLKLPVDLRRQSIVVLDFLFVLCVFPPPFGAFSSQPEMCGNGIRCMARFLADLEGKKEAEYKIHTLAGPIIPVVRPTIYTVCR